MMDLSQLMTNIGDLVKYGSQGGKEAALAEQERQKKAEQEATKRMNDEANKQKKEQAIQEGKLMDYFKQLKDDELHKIKVDKEKVTLLQQIQKLVGGTKPSQPKKVTPTSTPTQQPTPTPEKLIEVADALGLGTTFATKGKPNLPDRLVPYVNESASQNDINPIILASQLAQESGGFGYTPQVGTSGEQGVSQIIPKFHYKNAGVGDSNVYANMLSGDDQYSISEQARILGSYLKKRGNIYDALRQYNAGGNLEAGTNYATDILKRAGLSNLIGNTSVEDLSL